MTGNNKKGRRKRSEREQAKNANCPSSSGEDDKVLKLNELNQILINEIRGLREEKAILSSNLTEMVSEIAFARKLTEEWKETEKELRKELEKKDGEYRAAISQAGKQMQEAEERFNMEIFAKEKDCRAANLEKRNLEAIGLQLKNQIQVMSAELEATSKGAKLEKDVLLSQIVEGEKKIAEMSRSSQMVQEAWSAEKENLLSRVAELQTTLESMASEKGSLSETHKELMIEAESSKVQLREYSDKMVSMEATVLQLKNQIQVISAELEETSKDATLEKDVLLSKIVAAEKKAAEITRNSQMAEESWNAEKENLLGKLAELQTNLESMASDRGSLSETNGELRTETESFKFQLNEYKDKLASTEATVLQLKNQIQVISAELEETSKGAKMEKDVLLSQIIAAEKEAAELTRNSQMAEESSNAEKENLLERLTELQTNLKSMASEKGSLSETNKELKIEAESLKFQLNEYKDKLVSMEATVSQLNNKIQVISAELEATSKGAKLEKDVLLSQIVAAEKETAELNRSSQMTQEACNAQKENLLSKLAELQTNLELMASERESLSETNGELRTEAESLKVQLNDFNDKLVSIEDERQVLKTVSVIIAERLETLLKQNETMETKCRAVNHDKKNLEATVLQLKNQIQAISAELEATSKGAKLEKDVLVSQIVAAVERKIAEITRSGQTAQEAWNGEEENLLSRIAGLQTNLELMASENGSLTETNRNLSTEADSLKGKLTEYNDKLVSLEDERQVLKAVSVRNAERLEDLLRQNATMEKEITILQQQVDLNAREHSDVIQQYKMAENSLKKQNQMLEREFRGTKSLLEILDQTAYEMLVENGKHRNEVEGWSKKVVELQERHVKIVQEKDEQRREFESLHAEAVKKYKDVEQKYSELFEEKEEQAKMINALRGEITILQQQVDLNAKEHSDVIQQYKMAENSLKKQNQMLEREFRGTKSLLKILDQTAYEMLVENGKHRNEVEGWSKKVVELQERHVKIVQEKDEQRREFESLHAEAVKKYKDVEQKYSELFEEKEDQANMINTLRGEITILQQQVDLNAKEHSDVIQQYKMAENSLKKQNQMLEREFRGTKSLLKILDQTAYEMFVENGKLRNEVEGLSKKVVELQETHVKIMQEKDEQRREFESLHAEAVKKYKDVEEKYSELFKEKEEQAKMINTLRGEINFLMNEKSLPPLNLKEAPKKFGDLLESCLQIEHSTIAHEGRNALADIANRMDLQEKPKLSDANGKQNPGNVNEKPKTNDVSERKGAQENRKPKGGYQTKTRNKSQR